MIDNDMLINNSYEEFLDLYKKIKLIKKYLF